jgi:hypothetical protein
MESFPVALLHAHLACLLEGCRPGCPTSSQPTFLRLDVQGLAGDYYSTSAGQRERMLSSTQRLENSSSQLQQGREQLIQTEVCCFVVKSPLLFFGITERDMLVHWCFIPQGRLRSCAAAATVNVCCMCVQRDCACATIQFLALHLPSPLPS